MYIVISYNIHTVHYMAYYILYIYVKYDYTVYIYTYIILYIYVMFHIIYNIQYTS